MWWERVSLGWREREIWEVDILRLSHGKLLIIGNEGVHFEACADYYV